MPVTAHVSFYVELIKFTTELNEKLALIDKICL